MTPRIRIEIDPETNLRIQTVTGTFNGDLLVEILQRLYASPDYDPGRGSLWDLREADLSRLTAAEVEEACLAVKGLWDAQRAAPGRIAVLAAQEVGYGISRMYQSVMDVLAPGRVSVFLDRDEAVRWLGEGTRPGRTGADDPGP